MHLTGVVHQGEQLLTAHRRRQLVQRVLVVALLQDVDLALSVGIAHGGADQEAIQLGGRQ